VTAEQLLTTRTIGETENALDGVLTATLGGTGLDRLGWIALKLAAGGEQAISASALTDRLAATQKVDHSTAIGIIDDLQSRGIVTATADAIVLTSSGESLFRRLDDQIQRLTERIWAGLPVADLATADRVLSTIAERASAVLAATHPTQA
jgi:DNA-binding MarR family transcriptional regulator